MDLSNVGDSVYHRFRAAYSRTSAASPAVSPSLVFCTGPAKVAVEASWPDLQTQLPLSASGSPTSSGSAMSVASAVVKADWADSKTEAVWVYEMQRPGEAYIVGIAVVVTKATGEDIPAVAPLAFDAFFAGIVLRQIVLPVVAANKRTSTTTTADLDRLTDAVVNLFDRRLRYDIGADDQWAASGRAFFRQRVVHFTARGARIDLCLPAFPCKSSNPDKVARAQPDRGEALALRQLHSFVAAVEEVYAPGACVWIVSDGHVFSDCIGVDDAVVDDYGRRLRAMNMAIGGSSGRHRVGFLSLVDLFGMGEEDEDGDKGGLGLRVADLSADDQPPALERLVHTERTTASELARSVLMAGCQARPALLRARIDAQETAVLRLYRGFSRFMLEDLDNNRYTRALSRSQRRRLAARVAFAMIQRNQAYSNLVEMIFPCYVRLSIHAHLNTGPKFGIRLFGSGVRLAETLAPDAPAMLSADLLHVPTPWHNCVVELSTGSLGQAVVVYMTKAKAVRDALAVGRVVGNWVEGDDAAGTGGYYKLAMVARAKTLEADRDVRGLQDEPLLSVGAFAPGQDAVSTVGQEVTMVT